VKTPAERHNRISSPLAESAVENLLGRSPVRLEEHHIRGSLAGRVVLVTGAAGSIGSELCRQIARFAPAAIVGLDIAESPLFDSEREMRRQASPVPYHIEVGNIQNRARVDEILREYSPAVVFHAAAYKHVPLMERQVFEAIENNVFGTWNVASAAAQNGVRDFVLISSDKAVRPASVMGASKRVAELLTTALPATTKFVAVRFGNVLDSNGSVMRVFRKQIAAGGPVTVTHPDMRRFFMTLPEACQLVLQAAVIGASGQICVLDMGEPIRIVDLARKLISLSGPRAERAVRIAFTGIRPGEKLSEEAGALLENTLPTMHDKVRVVAGDRAPAADTLGRLDGLREICAARDTQRLVSALRELVPDYAPGEYLLDRVNLANAQAR
jgi:FlaA1/EpsC-like NDP-sugar epimerase